MKKLHRSRAVGWCAAIAGAVGLAGVWYPAFADPPTASEAAAPASTPAIDESAMALLKKAETKMLGLKTYQAECWTLVTVHSEGGKPPRLHREMASLTAVKPNLMRYDSWVMAAEKPDSAWKTWKRKAQTPEFTFVSNGKRHWRQFGAIYQENDRTSPRYLLTIEETWGGFYSTGDSPYSLAMSNRKKGSLLEVRRDGTEVVENVPCEKVFVHIRRTSLSDTTEIRSLWYIGPDGLVRRQNQRVLFSDRPGYTRDATLRNIRVNAPVPSRTTLFTYTPPRGVRKQNPPEKSRELPLLASGTPAPDFAATDRDGKPIRLTDYRGRVVVLDFWASWCPPCVASTPHNQQVMKKLQGENLPVMLLALDNSEGHDDFLKWINKRPELDAIVFAHADGKTADIAGKLYHVSGIPTQYVIDANGVIRASFVGYGGPTDALEKAVRAALENK